MLNTHACTYVGIRSKQKQGRSASPPKQIGNTYFHMQGAGLNVILKVYRLHDMHPGNMWNTVYILVDTYSFIYIYIYSYMYIHMNVYIYI